jgi:hypothetical protein
MIRSEQLRAHIDANGAIVVPNKFDLDGVDPLCGCRCSLIIATVGIDPAKPLLSMARGEPSQGPVDRDRLDKIWAI